MDRHYLLSSTFYGNWLPGSARGFVSSVLDQRPEDPAITTRHEHDLPGTDYDADFPGLYRYAQELLKGEPIWLTLEQAEVLLPQFLETAQYRGWQILAVAIMPNHIHIVVGVLGDPNPEKVLGDFKSYGSRALNHIWGKPASETWWTSKGSKRKLKDDEAIRNAIIYVRDQETPLVVWLSPEVARWGVSRERQCSR